MNSFQLYNDLIVDIEILREQIEVSEKEREQWYMGGRLFNSVPMENAIMRVDKLSDKIEGLESLLNTKLSMKNKLYKQLSRYEGLEKKIYNMRHIEGKTLKEISVILGYSYDYIREISSRMRKREEPTQYPQTS